MSPAGEVALVIMGPLLIIGAFAIHPVSVIAAYWCEREQNRRDILAGIEPEKTEADHG